MVLDKMTLLSMRVRSNISYGFCPPRLPPSSDSMMRRKFTYPISRQSRLPLPRIPIVRWLCPERAGALVVSSAVLGWLMAARRRHVLPPAPPPSPCYEPLKTSSRSSPPGFAKWCIRCVRAVYDVNTTNIFGGCSNTWAQVYFPSVRSSDVTLYPSLSDHNLPTFPQSTRNATDHLTTR